MRARLPPIPLNSQQHSWPKEFRAPSPLAGEGWGCFLDSAQDVHAPLLSQRFVGDHFEQDRHESGALFVFDLEDCPDGG